ncbi:RELT-like protein 2 isoform X2 [Anguilla anguilla]|uniref:RELT-like protein 2 isoform X2 n=1 Tax=Anguilla anguilla TaxID=7936 RepID=UPI0015ADFE76|nr:RELT-like protein 2 isoform X2 [Anguilla anguilla]
MTDLDATSGGEPHPQYMIFLLVFFFFLTGLLGFLICHMLKKKGYRCRTGDLEEEEECKDKLAPDDGPEENQDTVEQILKCIIENEANMEAFKEMLGNQNPCEHNVASRLPRKESLGGLPPHHHTVHSGADRNSCHLCAQNRSKKARRRNRVPRSKVRPGEQTVFSVGRFRVTHMEKKNSLQGSPNLPAKESVDHSDNTEPLDDQEDPAKSQEGYNLRNMFKQVSPTNGVVAVETKRKKSVTLFPPWKSSEPAAAAAKKPQETAAAVAAVMEVVIDDDDDDNGDCPDSTEQPESPVPPPEEGTDTDVPTDSEMAGDKVAANGGDKVAANGGDKAGASAEDKVAAGAQAAEDAGAGDKVAPSAEDAGAPEQPAPARMRQFSVVRTGQRAEEAAMPGEFGRDDMVEMEDIKDCRVSLEEDSRPSWEEKRRSVHTQHKW